MTAHNSIIDTRGQRIDDWLANGGVVLASNERLARSLRGVFNRRREAEGLTAWPTPPIFEWKSFLRAEWDQKHGDGRMVLSPLQEEWLFARIAQKSAVTAATLHGPRMRLAAMAREAHELLCEYAPQYLDSEGRYAWPGDSETFHQWLTEFESTCESEGWLSSARIPLEIAQGLSIAAGGREALLLAGFDRLTPTQTRFLDAWGRYEVLSENGPTPDTRFISTQDAASELAACALWCRKKLEANPSSRLLIISQDAALRRGEIERAFSRFLNPDSSSAVPIEFSIGIPLAKTPLVQGALLILRWISKKPLAENEVDWLIATGLTAESEYETTCLHRQMKGIRERNMQRPEWTLEAFINARPKGVEVLPESWTRRMLSALRRIEENGGRRSAVEWAELLPLCMKDCGWPGNHPMTSANFQAVDQWTKAIERCATLGFDGHPLSWPVFHSALARELEDALFSPESQGSSILITGPAQSAGLVADGIWFLGAEEDEWPFAGQPHPFLPLFVQREADMPHSSVKTDSELAAIVTQRLLHSAPEVVFSYSMLRDKAESNPSHMIAAVAGEPVGVPPELVPDELPEKQTVEYEDKSRVPYAGTKAEGGATTLTLQSNCAFKSFATARLAARSWDAAETGLNPRQRGDLVHLVLRLIWGGKATGGWTSSSELMSLLQSEGREGLENFVRHHAKSAMASIPASLRERMPRRYLELEEARLVRLVREWLLYESTRGGFTVSATEQKTPVVVAGLALDLRLDREDVLEDGSVLIVDYKTGANGTPDQWASSRPEDVQLPLYACFGASQVPGTDPGGLVFARVKTGEMEFAGRLRNPLAVLPSVGKTSAMVKYPLTDDDLENWRFQIEKLAIDFLNGRADVNPRDTQETCENCKLATLCRIRERQDAVSTQ